MTAMTIPVYFIVIFVALFPGMLAGMSSAYNNVNVILMPYYFTTVTLTSSAESVCPGDTVVFTCVTDTVPLIWSTTVNEHVKVYHSSDQVSQPAVNLGGIFMVKLISTTGQFESTAAAYNVSSDYNGVNITCSNNVNDVLCSKTRSITVGEKI